MDEAEEKRRWTHLLGDPGAVSRDATRIGTGVKFSSKARRALGNIPLTDEFQSDLNSDYLIGRKFPQLSFSAQSENLIQ